MPEFPKVPAGYDWRWSDQHRTWYLFEERSIFPTWGMTEEMLESTDITILQELVDEAIYNAG